MKQLIVRKAAVLGAGVMGAQIAAHLANAGVPVALFDLPAPTGERSGIAARALAGLAKLEPAPLASRERLALITPANYDEHLPLLGDCDLVIEAIAERPDWKLVLYARIAPHLASAAILASNTSGLAISALAEGLPAAARPRFCGLHFFNPPRYLPLVEIVAGPQSDPALLDALESWLVTRLGKNVVRALDTPNFLANRIGVFSLLAAMHHTVACGLGFDEVDALTGTALGRPKSATYRTADVVGLDTLAHVVATLREQLPDDPWHGLFELPAWLRALIDRGALGQKSGAGIYRKEGREIRVLDLQLQDYRPAAGAVAPEVAAVLKLRRPAEKFAALRACEHPQARFLWALFRDLFHYCAVQLGEVADNARDLDFALRWGFGWSEGPFETWQAAGWGDIAQALAADIAAGRALSAAPLPAWALEPGRGGVHTPAGSWSARRQTDVPRSPLPVYRRQLFPERLFGEGAPPGNGCTVSAPRGGQENERSDVSSLRPNERSDVSSLRPDLGRPGVFLKAAAPEQSGETLFENAGLRLWRLPEIDAGIGIVSFKTKMHTLGDEVLDGLLAAVAQAEAELDGLVLWHAPPFSAGADLQQASAAFAAGGLARLETTVAKFQRVSQAIKYAQRPVVAAVQGLALGGGCEFLMHAARRVLALESYIGLVEAGVGLIPAGGGCKEFALRAAAWAARSARPLEVMDFLQPVFQNVALAKVSGSALEAIDHGFARPDDVVLANPHELLYVAIRQARGLFEAGYAPPPPARAVPVAGRGGIANCETMLLNMREGGMISAHDYRVAKAAATALCGGEVDSGSRVDEEWLLAVERRCFLELLQTPETQARIRHMLETGKPLRN